MLLDVESSKYSDLGTVFVINTRTGLANFYGLTKLKYVYGIIFVLHLDSTSKRSAKGVVQHSQQQLTHQRFRETLLSGKTLRIYNYSKKLKAHTNITIAQNRIALSPFDSKRFLLFDGIATLPFGHRFTEENVFFEAIMEESEWENSQLTNIPRLIAAKTAKAGNHRNSGSQIGAFFKKAMRRKSFKKKAQLAVQETLRLSIIHSF